MSSNWWIYNIFFKLNAQPTQASNKKEKATVSKTQRIVQRKKTVRIATAESTQAKNKQHNTYKRIQEKVKKKRYNGTE